MINCVVVVVVVVVVFDIILCLFPAACPATESWAERGNKSVKLQPSFVSTQCHWLQIFLARSTVFDH